MYNYAATAHCLHCDLVPTDLPNPTDAHRGHQAPAFRQVNKARKAAHHVATLQDLFEAALRLLAHPQWCKMPPTPRVQGLRSREGEAGVWAEGYCAPGS